MKNKSIGISVGALCTILLTSCSGGGGGGGSSTPPAAPVASSVTISGATLWPGTTLTGGYVYSDSSGAPEGASKYQWLSNGVPMIAIDAQSISHTLTAQDFNTTIGFEVTPVTSAGTGAVAGSTVAVNLASLVNQYGGLSWSPFNLNIYNWSAANTYCTTATINGTTGWRLPTISELNNYLHAAEAALITQAVTGVSTSYYYWSSTAGGSVGTHSTIWLIYTNPIDLNDSTSNLAVCTK